ncbi:hypothetical protein C8R47DRAFT_807523 [Mycena vitilis]|nr:hypothetical protein C8R47DRAFT_807523 [Mycena vitilis]
MASFGSQPVFPPEITDSIIHQLSPDLPTLRVCSLVSRAWIPASRYLLHETIALRGEDMSSFLELIAAAENTYLATVRAVNLSLCENGPTESLLKLLPQFLSLKSIRIYSSIFHYDLPVISGVTALELSGTHIRSVLDFTTLLARLPALKHLKLDAVSWGSSDGWAPVASSIGPVNPTRLELDTFSVQIPTDPLFLDWLGSAKSGPITSDLMLCLPIKLQGRDQTKIHCKISEYLRHLNVSLKRLHLRFVSRFKLEHLHFTTNTSLQSIHIDFHIMGEVTRRGSTSRRVADIYLCETLPALLERFRSDHIDELIIDIHKSSVTEEPVKLSSVLSTPPFSRVRRLRFNGDWDSDEARGSFITNMIDKLPVSSRAVVLVHTDTWSRRPDNAPYRRY